MAPDSTDVSVEEAFNSFFQQNLFDMVFDVGLGLLIVLVSYALGRVLSRMAAGTFQRMPAHNKDTLGPLIKSGVFFVVFTIGVIMAMGQMGINVSGLLAGAGILGLAIGFGAQSLVKDVISGFFLIFDGVIEVGDYVEILDKAGYVEAIGLRRTRVRDFDGALWYIPNGEIVTVANHNREWVRATVAVGVAYNTDIDHALEVMREVGETWAQEQDRAALVDDEPQAQGVIDFGSSEIVLRLIVRTDPAQLSRWEAERQLRRRVKAAFDRHGVEIPFPQRVLHTVHHDPPRDEDRDPGGRAAA